MVVLYDVVAAATSAVVETEILTVTPEVVGFVMPSVLGRITVTDWYAEMATGVVMWITPSPLTYAVLTAVPFTVMDPELMLDGNVTVDGKSMRILPLFAASAPAEDVVNVIVNWAGAP